MWDDGGEKKGTKAIRSREVEAVREQAGLRQERKEQVGGDGRCHFSCNGCQTVGPAREWMGPGRRG